MEKSFNIFISYSWADSKFANQLDSDFSAIGISLIRDIRGVAYKGNLKDFMKKVNESDYVLMLISDSFLRSQNCMYEVLELLENDDFADKILPITLPDLDIYAPKERVKYLKYWENKFIEAKSDLESLKVTLEDASIRNAVKHYRDILDSLDGFMNFLTDHLTISFSKTSENNFKDILNFIGIPNIETLTESLRIRNMLNKQEQKEAIKKALKNNPDEQHFQLRNAYLLHKEKKLGQAQDEYKKIISKYPDFVLARVNYAILLHQLNKQNEAEFQYKEAVKIDKKNPILLNNFATYVWASGDPDTARDLYSDAISIDPSYSLSYANLAGLNKYVYKNEGLAILFLEKAIALNPQIENFQMIDWGKYEIDQSKFSFLETKEVSVDEEPFIDFRPGGGSGGGIGIVDLRDFH